MKSYRRSEQSINKKPFFTKKMIALIGGVALAGIGYFTTPLISTAYKKHKAEDLIEETAAGLKDFNCVFNRANQILEQTKFIMVGEDELAPLNIEINDSTNHKGNIEKILSQTEADFKAENFDGVRIVLDTEFGLDDDQKRETPLTILQREKTELSKRVIAYCDRKLKSRNGVVNTEWYLKSRLKKPLPFGTTKKTDELKDVPNNFFKMIPVLNVDLESRLQSFPSELYNSFGVGLINYQKILSHILEVGKTNKIKSNAQKMYDLAFSEYIQVMPGNDKLIWYRPQRHDGEWNMQQYQELLAAQAQVMKHVKTGDKALEDLRNYFKELHSQHYTFVSDHSKSRTTFTETEMYMDFSDDDGPTLRTRTVSVPGYKFFFTTTTVTPRGKSSETHYVGKKKGSRARWSYPQDQQEGWVVEWKPLHFDNKGIKHGWMKNLNPRIEKLSDSCRK